MLYGQYRQSSRVGSEMITETFNARPMTRVAVCAAFVAYVVSMTMLALLKGDVVIPVGLALICLGAAQMLAVCLLAGWQ